MIMPQLSTQRNSEQITNTQFNVIMSSLTVPGYVPPVSPFKLGRLALRKGFAPQSHWPALMVQGWNFEGPYCYAEAGGM